jgi:hypothetical protein
MLLAVAAAFPLTISLSGTYLPGFLAEFMGRKPLWRSSLQRWRQFEAGLASFMYE